MFIVILYLKIYVHIQQTEGVYSTEISYMQGTDHVREQWKIVRNRETTLDLKIKHDNAHPPV